MSHPARRAMFVASLFAGALSSAPALAIRNGTIDTGDPAVHGDCLGWLCVTTSHGGGRICSVNCDPDAKVPCTSGYACELVPDRAGETACLPAEKPEPNGCSMIRRAPDRPAAGVLVLLGCLFIITQLARRT